MAFPTSVNSQITDSVTQVNTKVLGDAPAIELSPYLRNYVAAMVEQAAHQKNLPAPPWLCDIQPLEEPHFAAPLANLRLHLLRASPVPFRRRNIFVDSGVGSRV